jgi:hypothetical protein
MAGVIQMSDRELTRLRVMIDLANDRLAGRRRQEICLAAGINADNSAVIVVVRQGPSAGPYDAGDGQVRRTDQNSSRSAPRFPQSTENFLRFGDGTAKISRMAALPRFARAARQSASSQARTPPSRSRALARGHHDRACPGA